MALSATCILEVQYPGSDTNSAGLFDPGQSANFLTDGAATLATGTAPLFSSASYVFVAGDIGAYVYIASGLNWLAAWYRITAVSSGIATLAAMAGQVTLANGTLSAVNGCATTASPTSATWSIDYSRQNTAQFTYTDLTAGGAGSTLTSAAHPFGKQQVGNALVLTGGTNCTTGRFVIASVASTTATLDRAVTTGATSSGSGSLGGAFATPGKALSIAGSSNRIYVQYSASGYLQNVNPASYPAGVNPAYNVAANRITGYNTYRGDNPTGSGRPTIKAVSGATEILNPNGTGWLIENLILDCNAIATVGIFVGTYSTLRNCWIKAIASNQVAVTAGDLANILECEISGGNGATSQAINMLGGGTIADCYIHDNAGYGIVEYNGKTCTITDCILYNNGADGCYIGYGVTVTSCDFANNGGNGIYVSTPYYIGNIFRNNIFDSNGAYGINFASGDLSTLFPGESAFDFNAFYNNALGARHNMPVGPHDVTLTGSPFTSKPTDWSLNNTANQGAVCRAVGIPGAFSGLVGTVGYRDLGAIQHADPAPVSGSASGSIFVSSVLQAFAGSH